MSRPALKPCGTPAAYRRHLRKGEQACAACRKAHWQSVQTFQRRARERGYAPRELKPCGSEAAYQRHLRRGEKSCFSCRVAHSHYVAKYVKASRARKRAA